MDFQVNYGALDAAAGGSRTGRTRTDAGLSAPLLRSGIEAQHVQHGTNQDLLTVDTGNIPRSKSRISGLEVLVQDRERAGDVEVVVHGGDEGLGQIGGTQGNLGGRSPAGGAPGAASEGSESRPPSVNGWFNKVSYLKHESAANSNEESAHLASVCQTEPSQQDTATSDMTALEFIQEEDEYGNTVVADQLLMGEWS